jgi:hypothetical protein
MSEQPVEKPKVNFPKKQTKQKTRARLAQKKEELIRVAVFTFLLLLGLGWRYCVHAAGSVVQ